MGIKSAYELAMERAKNIKVDKNELNKKARENKGKEAASAFLNKPKYDFSKWLSEVKEEEKSDSVNGAMWVFKKNIRLPYSTADVDRLLKIKEGVNFLSDKKEVIENIFTQLTTVFQQYIETSKQILEQCKQQYAPQLQQKQMQIAQQTGQMIELQPEQDKDFIEFHKQNQDHVDTQFIEVLNQLIDAMDTLL